MSGHERIISPGLSLKHSVQTEDPHGKSIKHSTGLLQAPFANHIVRLNEWPVVF